MRTNRPYVQIDPDVLERVRQIDLLSYLREFEPSNLVIGNKHSPTVIIAAITSRVHTKAKLPTHTPVSNYEGLDKDSVILLEQIRTIDKQRLKQYMGMMPNNIMARVDKALAISVALEKNENKCVKQV